MDNAIADDLSNLFEKFELCEMMVTTQYEIVMPMDSDIHTGIGIWADVAVSWGIQMVADGFITARRR